MFCEQIKEYIENNLSLKRYRHSVSVAEEAKKLAEKYNASTQKAYFAGLAHDMAKEIDKEEVLQLLKKFGREDLAERYPYPLIHGPVSALILKNDFSVEDEEILDAVWYHTTGKEDMSLMTKIIYIADFIEPNRNFEGVESVRKLAYVNIDKAIVEGAGIVICNTISRALPLDVDTVLARNYLLNNNKI